MTGDSKYFCKFLGQKYVMTESSDIQKQLISGNALSTKFSDILDFNEESMQIHANKKKLRELDKTLKNYNMV